SVSVARSVIDIHGMVDRDIGNNEWVVSVRNNKLLLLDQNRDDSAQGKTSSNDAGINSESEIGAQTEGDIGHNTRGESEGGSTIYEDETDTKSDSESEIESENERENKTEIPNYIITEMVEDKEDEGGSWGVKRMWKQVIEKPFAILFGPLLNMAIVEAMHRPTSVHPFYAARLEDAQHRLAYIWASVIGVVFGGIHLIGWDFPFATTAELWLWRASSLVLTIIPAIIVVSWRSKVEWWLDPDRLELILFFTT
ncbi:hypothetical protein AX16_005768, partial [Volvariella volvacea WC 439]